MALHRRAQRLYDEATAQARDLADRTAELRQVEERLQLAHQRELIDTERHRIARELHDSVTQYVLSAGMAVEVARGDAEALGEPGADPWCPAGHRQEAHPGGGRAAAPRDLRPAPVRTATPSRRCPSCCTRSPSTTSRTSPCSCASRASRSALPADADHEIARAVGEALFNVATHAQATPGDRAAALPARRAARLGRRRRPRRPHGAAAAARLERGTHGRRPAPRPGQHRVPDRRPRRQRSRSAAPASAASASSCGSRCPLDARPLGRPRRRPGRPTRAAPDPTEPSTRPRRPPDGHAQPVQRARHAAASVRSASCWSTTTRSSGRDSARSWSASPTCGWSAEASSRRRGAGRRRPHPARSIVLLDLKLSTSSDSEGIELCAELTRASTRTSACWC